MTDEVIAGQTDVANAHRFTKLHGEDMRWCGPWNRWVIWEGNRWAQESKCESTDKAKAVFRQFGSEIGMPGDA
ncbi:MAG TPA: hypothetical protein VHC22_12345 [Pirellulales bacterium]|nr:hypothetical protein [Pirellulales bacterium]